MPPVLGALGGFGAGAPALPSDNSVTASSAHSGGQLGGGSSGVGGRGFDNSNMVNFGGGTLNGSSMSSMLPYIAAAVVVFVLFFKR